MKTIISEVVAALNAALGDNQDIGVTVLGKVGQGNVRVRVHYKRDNLVAAILYRSDLYTREMASSDPVDQYLQVLPVGDQPWTEFPKKGMASLVAIPLIVGRDAAMTLPESMAVSDSLLGVLESFPRANAFIRQWRANNGGTGVEIIFVHKDEEGKRHVFECVVNYYHQVDPMALAERIKSATKQ
ncbi:hypothetical protein D3C85_15590 [compost metagenome]